MKSKAIIYIKEDNIAFITMNRPENMNAFSPDLIDGIYNAVEDSASDDDVRVVILTGKGRAFSAGADVKAMAKAADRRKGQGRTPMGGNARLALLFRRIDKPIIAAVNGVAAGGGFDLACACDIRIASDKARFAEVFIRRGLIPALGGTYFLPRLVGIDKACQLIWTGDMIDAEEALRIGLVTMVVPHEELEIASLELAEKLVKAAPLAIQRAKRAIYDGLSMDLQACLEYAISVQNELRETQDHKEGAKAFVEKREPLFKGK